MAKVPPRFSPRTGSKRVVDQPLVAVTVRLPKDLHKWLSQKALDDETSIQQMAVTAFRAMRPRSR